MKLTDFPAPVTIAALREVGVTHVVVHTEQYPGDEWRAVESRLARSQDLALLHSDGPGRVYAVRPR
jgi:hypothetical protein